MEDLKVNRKYLVKCTNRVVHIVKKCACPMNCGLYLCDRGEVFLPDELKLFSRFKLIKGGMYPALKVS